MSRYDRQTRFHPFGEDGQHQISTSQILVFGAGALGSHIIDQLARMGANHLTVIDMDIVETSNLHRQTLYDEEDAYHLVSKVEAVKNKVSQINSEVTLTAYDVEVTSSNIEDIVSEINPDIIIDGMDNFKVRFLINEVCHKYEIPWVYGAAVGSKGTFYGIDYQGPCLKCLMQTIPETGESCAINGVLPPIVSIVASYEVAEVIRYLSGKGFSKQMITIDAFDLGYKAMNVDILKNNECPVCENHQYDLLETKQENTIEQMCGHTYLFRMPKHAFDYSNHFPGNIVKATSFAKLIKYENYEFTLFKDGRMNAYGVHSDEEASGLYHTLIKSIR